MKYEHNEYWMNKISETIHSSLNSYPRTLMLRVDLRLPNISSSNDDAAISRFIDSLKAKITAHHKKKENEGKRVHKTTLRYIWVKEYGEINNKKHYHMILLLNRDTWCRAGDYRLSNSLAGMIKQAWCSALKIDNQLFASLVHFPINSSLWINKGNQFEFDQAIIRASYLAKYHTKSIGEKERNFGCSRG